MMEKMFLKWMMPAMLGACLATGCGKDNGSDEAKPDKDVDATRYVIVGKEFQGTNVQSQLDYIISFSADKKATLYTTTGKFEASYSTEGTRITITDNGYIDVDTVNNLISNTLLATWNLQDTKLLPVAATDQLTGKSLQGYWRNYLLDGSNPVVYSNFTAILTDKVLNTLAIPNTNPPIPVTMALPYTNIGNVAGFIDGDGKNGVFYFDPGNGKLAFSWFQGSGNYSYFEQH